MENLYRLAELSRIALVRKIVEETRAKAVRCEEIADGVSIIDEGANRVKDMLPNGWGKSEATKAAAFTAIVAIHSIDKTHDPSSVDSILQCFNKLQVLSKKVEVVSEDMNKPHIQSLWLSHFKPKDIRRNALALLVLSCVQEEEQIFIEETLEALSKLRTSKWHATLIECFNNLSFSIPLWESVKAKLEDSLEDASTMNKEGE